MEGYFDVGRYKIFILFLHDSTLAVLLLVFVTIALDAPDNLSTSLSLCLLTSNLHLSFSHGLFL